MNERRRREQRMCAHQQSDDRRCRNCSGDCDRCEERRRYRNAVSLGKAGRLRECEATLQRLTDSPDSSLLALAYNGLGVLQGLQCNWNDAKSYFLQALQIDADCRCAQTNLDRTRPANSARTIGRRRIAVLSFLFNWPSRGGGNLHSYELVKTISVAAPYRSRRHGMYVAYSPRTKRRFSSKGSGLVDVSMNGFGCVLLRRDALQNQVFTAAGDVPDFDLAFYERLRDRPVACKLDWSLECEHLDAGLEEVR